jgi:hypothetical protein
MPLKTPDMQEQQKNPSVNLYGYALERFSVGQLMEQDDLADQEQFLQHWIVQQSQSDSQLTRYVRIEKGKLHVHDPRGCTIWYKTMFSVPLIISYRVTCPSEYNSNMDIVPRDINQFWMAVTPKNVDPNAAGGLFDKNTYDGEFDSYHDLLGYYASTGGGSVTKNNRTTRLRRYPRKMGDTLSDHVALCSRDDQKEFLIVPDKEHLVQLVAAGDIVQYIFDGKIVYELKKGESVDILNDDNKAVKKGVWGNEPWTIYQQGYFGFRMTRTHHIYSDFRVYRLIAK